MSNFRDQVGDINDYSNMPKFELQQRAIYGDEKAERIYAQRYSQKNKNAELTEILKKWSAAIKDNLEKSNPNRDSKGRFTFGSGGPKNNTNVGGGGSSNTSTQEGANATDYRGFHTAPRRSDGFGAPATNVEEMMPDFYKRPDIYTTGMPQADKESVSVIMSIRGKPNKPVTIYRAVPKKVNTINHGDWVTLSPTYAKQHLLSNLEAGHVISKIIPAGDLWFDGDSINEFGYDPVKAAKFATIQKANPNHDSRGRFTYGSGGPQGGGSGGGGKATGEIAQGKDITSELGKEYGTTSETKRAQELRTEHMTANYDPVLKDIAHKQGFDGEAEILDQKAFDKVVADGGTVTYRGVTGYYEHRGPDAKFIEGDSQITDQFAKGKYYAGAGGYGNGTYTTSDISVAQHYSTANGEIGGGMITMVVKPGAKIATPAQWATARMAAKEGKGGFMGSDDPGRILAAQGFDGFRIAAKNVDHFSNQFTVILNRTAVAVLKK